MAGSDRGLPAIPRGLDRGLSIYLQSLSSLILRLSGMVRGSEGVNPNSGRFQGMQAAQDISKAAQMAGARTQARVGAEQENYDRLTKAAQYNATGGILQGINLMRS